MQLKVLSVDEDVYILSCFVNTDICFFLFYIYTESVSMMSKILAVVYITLMQRLFVRQKQRSSVIKPLRGEVGTHV